MVAQVWHEAAQHVFRKGNSKGEQVPEAVLMITDSRAPKNDLGAEGRWLRMRWAG